MYRSQQGHVEVLFGNDLGNIVFADTAWTISSMPSKGEAGNFFKNLFANPVVNHILLMLNRDDHNPINALSNLPIALTSGWKFMESVGIVYGKASQDLFSKNFEPGYLFYKGSQPDVSKTAWFAQHDQTVASNLWDVGITNFREAGNTVYQRFSWQLNLLLRSLAGHIPVRSFNYLCPVDNKDLKLISDFCVTMGFKCYLVAPSAEEAKKIIKFVDSLESKSLDHKD